MPQEIQLSQGKFAIVDDEDYEWLSQWKWCAYRRGCNIYAARMGKKLKGKQETIHMHIEIIGKKEGFVTDHINGNGLDNRRENLRHVTRRQNQQNRHNETTSKYPGVSWAKRDRMWTSNIFINGRLKHLGYFNNEADAYNAYCKAVTANGENILSKNTIEMALQQKHVSV